MCRCVLKMGQLRVFHEGQRMHAAVFLADNCPRSALAAKSHVSRALGHLL